MGLAEADVPQMRDHTMEFVVLHTDDGSQCLALLTVIHWYVTLVCFSCQVFCRHLLWHRVSATLSGYGVSVPVASVSLDSCLSDGLLHLLWKDAVKLLLRFRRKDRIHPAF